MPQELGSWRSQIGPEPTVFLAARSRVSHSARKWKFGSPITVDGTGATMVLRLACNTNDKSWWILQHMHWADQATAFPVLIGGSNGIIDDAYVKQF